ncbi:MAG: HlyD family efflux transporter periplasmic adaptor subunit [Synechococcus sp.]
MERNEQEEHTYDVSYQLLDPTDEPALAPPAAVGDFLPPIGQWPTVGGLAMLIGFVGAVGLSAVLPYRVTVQATGRIRPAGDLRLVQATAEGTVEQIAVEENQRVERGDVMVTIDDSQLLTRQRQLETSLERGREQLERLSGELDTLDGQIEAQTEAAERDAAAYQAELELEQRDFRERQLVTQADMDAVEAEVELAREEYQRYQQLAQSGGVSQLQVLEREASYNAALARLERARAALNPSESSVNRASERLEQIRSSNLANLAALRREREALLKEQLELEELLLQEEDDLAQVEDDLQKTVVRAPIGGIIQQLNLRNIDQVVERGEEIATIAPANTELVIEAYVASRDINWLEIGQTGQMRVSSCPYPDFGTLQGTVSSIAPDVSILNAGEGPQDSSASTISDGFYKVQIQPTVLEMISQGRRCSIQPGMEGRLDIETDRESVMSFILRRARLLSNF